MNSYTDEEIKRYEAVIDEATQLFHKVKPESIFKDLLGAIYYLDDLREADNQRIKEQARTIMNLHEQILKDDSTYDPLGLGAIVELIDRYPLPDGNYFPGGQVGVVNEIRARYHMTGETGEYVGVRFPGHYETFKVSTAIIRIIRRPQHAR